MSRSDQPDGNPGSLKGPGEWGFLVSVEAMRPIPHNLIESALDYYLEEWPDLGVIRVEVSPLGRVDVDV